MRIYSRTDVAKVWLEKAREEDDEYNSFIASWIAFNALYNEQSNHNEKDRITAFIEKIKNPIYEELLADINAFQEPIRDLRPESTKTTQTDIDQMNKSDSALGTRLAGLMRCIYQVRCNLFHGDKFIENSRNRHLAKESAIKVTRFLELYLEDK